MLLSITIPTYNRANDLDKNLSLITNLILDNHLENEVEIILSSNHSSDNTPAVAEKYKSSGVLKYFEQERNLGFLRNILFAINEAAGEYCMLMGDDDYMEKEFFLEVVRLLKENKNLGCIVPNFIGILPDGTIPNESRDHKFPSKFYPKGLRNCKFLAWRGSQMSGIVVRREGLCDYFQKNKIVTAYPQITMIALSVLHADAYHLTDHPVKVTNPGQNNKAWSYGKDGLVADALGGIIDMDESYWVRMNLQFSIIRNSVCVMKLYKKWWQRRTFVWTVFWDSRTMLLPKFYFLYWCLIYDVILLVKRLPFYPSLRELYKKLQ